MRSQRWLHRLVGLFPESFRETRGDEIHDALDDQTRHGWALVTESLSLIYAAVLAWRRQLVTKQGVRRTMFVGSLAWFGTLFAFGAIRHIETFSDIGGPTDLYPGALSYALIGIALLVLAFVATLKSRLGAATLGLIGIVFIAHAQRQDSWSLVTALRHNTMWLGVPLAMALIFRSERPPRWPVLAVASIPGVVAVFVDYAPSYQNEALFVLCFVALSLWAALSTPSVGALAAPIFLHISIIEPEPLTTVPCVALLGILWMRTIGRPTIRSWADRVRSRTSARL